MAKTKKLADVVDGLIQSTTTFIVINDGIVEKASNLEDYINEHVNFDVISESEIDQMFKN